MPAGVKEDPFAFMFEEKALDLGGGHVFKFRELSVAENDACLDSARDPKTGEINGRVNMRMAISKSAVDPKISIDDIAKFPNRIYLRIAEFVNEINSVDDALDEEQPVEDEGNG